MHKNQNYKIGIYIRVSTEEQAENPEGSIRNQEQRLRESIIWRNRTSSFGELVGVYVDAGISAKDMKRPQLLEMLRDMKMGKINLILVTELSRLSRSNRDFLSMWDSMHEHKCSFMSLREDFDTTTAAGEMLLFQLINFAQFERKQTSERVTANILARSSRGLFNGGSIPLGYTKHPENKSSLAVDTEHVETIRTVFSTYLKMGSLSSTARWLNDNGFKAKAHHEGGGSRMRVGHFMVDNVQNILRNKAYIGIKVYTNKSEIKEVKASWDAIVDEAIFNRANELLTKNKSRLKPIKGENRYPYLLSGVAFCMTCGDFMPGKSATGRNGKVPYYEHSWAVKRDSCLTKKTFKCDPHRVQEKILGPLVWNEFLRLLESDHFILSLLEQVKRIHGENDSAKEYERLKAKLYGLNSQLDALAERIAILPKSVSAVPLFKQMEKIEEHKKDIEEKLLAGKEVNLDQRLVPLETFSEFSKIMKKSLSENPDANVKKMILQKFARRVEIGTDSVKIYWNVDKEFYTNELSQAKACGSFKLVNGSGNVGSNSLTIGASGETRTRTSLRAADFESDVFTNSLAR
jgi:DNA invertase Pin-like site-specific DNA recombinase